MNGGDTLATRADVPLILEARNQRLTERDAAEIKERLDSAEKRLKAIEQRLDTPPPRPQS